MSRKPTPSAKEEECASCGARGNLDLSFHKTLTGAAARTRLVPCERCSKLYYCSRLCQQEHWQRRHRFFCIPPRYPTAAVERVRLQDTKIVSTSTADVKSLPPPPAQSEASDFCVICEEPALNDCQSLGCKVCGVIFHVDCAWGLDQLGLTNLCPYCDSYAARTPAALFDNAIRRLFRISRRIERRADSFGWLNLPDFDRNELKEIIGMLEGAASDGNGREGSAVAQYNLGLLVLRGVISPNGTSAQFWFKSAANKGLSLAQFALGTEIEKEQCLSANEQEKSDSAAAYWYRLSAAQGHSQAMVALARMYRSGRGVTLCHAEAVRLLRKAAEGKHLTANFPWGRASGHPGFAEAQYNLAEMYWHGLGVNQSSSKAMMWFDRAKDQNYEPAKRALRRLKKGGTKSFLYSLENKKGSP